MRTAITFNNNHEKHAQPGHFERPERIHAIRNLLEADGILENLMILPATAASIDDVLLVHPRKYYDRLEEAVAAGGAQLDPDTYTKPASLQVALQALGGLLNLTDAVLKQDIDNGFAAIRPPGHHARPGESMGFCLLANVAISAKWAQKLHGLKKVLIVDFDVHHGNGTQEIFYEDPSVMYMSTHQSPLYPGTGLLEETGAGEARGTTINIPLPAKTGDVDFARVFLSIMRPLALGFNPDLIFVSAGYDAHWMDPIGGMNLSIEGFANILREILSWAKQCTDNKLIALLEGGYNTDALAHCVLTTLRLLQDPNAVPSDPFGKAPKDDADISDTWDRLISFHKQRTGDS